MLAGSVEPAARILQQVARSEGGSPLATVVGTGRRTGAVWAALCNGTAAHALDFDDTNFALMGHPSAPGAGRGPRRGRAGAGRRPRGAARLPAGLRGRDHAGRGHQPGPLRPRLARHLYARHAGRRGGGGATARARRRADPSRARGGRVAVLGAEGKLRHHDQALPRRTRGAERGAVGADGARGLDRLRARARRAAGLLQRAGRGQARSRRRSARSPRRGRS